MTDADRSIKAFWNTGRKPNRLLQVLVVLSVGVHVLIYLHVAGLYRSSAIDYIELSMQDLSNSFTRTIPRPVIRPKIEPQPDDIKKIEVIPNRIPQINPSRIDPVDNSVSKDLVAQISAPETPSDLSGGQGAYQIGEILDTASEFTNEQSYYEMVVLKIETSKKYPESAKTAQHEGRITIGFTLTLQGNVRDIRVIKPSPHAVLNQAAERAVREAAPFPRPPFRYFKKDIPFEVNIIFETT